MQAVVSVDGYIAYPDDTVGPLFDWYGNGDCTVQANEKWAFSVSRASAEYVKRFWDAIEVTVIGRHLFDTTDGWAGVPAAGDALVVVTHRPLPEEWLARFPDAPFHTAGSVEAGIALAKQIAGDGLVCVTAGDVGGQAFLGGPSRRGSDGRRPRGHGRRGTVLRQPHRHRPARRPGHNGPGRPRAAPALHRQPGSEPRPQSPIMTECQCEPDCLPVRAVAAPARQAV
jgi:hypothetical protein